MACQTMKPLPGVRLLPGTSTAKFVTLTLLHLCQNVQEVKQLHAQCFVSGFLDHPACARRLLESYVTMSDIHSASSIFDKISSPDVFVYNNLIRGLIMCKRPSDALLLYSELLLEYLTPDNYTFTFALKACSHLRALSEGKQVHCRMLKTGLAPDTHVHSSLINMYANSGSVEDSERVLRGFPEENLLANNAMISGYLSAGQVDKAIAVFDSMKAKDVATWSAIITGYTKNNLHTEALVLFQQMMESRTLPNESVLVSLLSACAKTGALQQGRRLHAYIDKTDTKLSIKLSTALIDMYAKCGSPDCAYELFKNMTQRDSITYGAMISGFAIHGQAGECIHLFNQMIADGIRPNEVIFTSMLSACSHAGYVDEGQDYFGQMVENFHIKPSVEHYGCMVDLLSRAGRLAEAEGVILTMTEQPNSIIWGGFLSGCRTYNDVKRGSWAFKKLMELDPTAGDRWKLAGIMFANAGDKEMATEIRKMINEKGIETTTGSSFVEVDGKIHEFMVGDVMNDKASEVYYIMELINSVC